MKRKQPSTSTALSGMQNPLAKERGDCLSLMDGPFRYWGNRHIDKSCLHFRDDEGGRSPQSMLNVDAMMTLEENDT